MEPRELRERLQGVVGIAITPMHEDGRLDMDGWRDHLDFLVSNGIDGENGVIVTTGSTGECGALTIDERQDLLEAAIAAVGDEVPIVAGVNHSGVAQVTELVRHAEAAGASGVMLTPPYYYPATDAVSRAFYEEIAERTDLGLLLYNNVPVSGNDLSVSTLDELAEVPNIVGIKECTTDFNKMEEVARTIGDRMTVVNGNGEFFEPYAALAGLDGFISTAANFAPALTVAVWNARRRGDLERAKRIRDEFLPYLDLAREYGARGGEPKVLMVLKRAADLAGSHGGGGRLPLQELTEEEAAEIEAMVRNVGNGNID